MRLRPVLAVVTLLLLAAPASATTQTVITERDSGKTFRVSRGHVRTLRLSTTYRWTEPRVKGGAVRLTPVYYFVDPGFLEWTIQARARGTARISAVGDGQTTTLFRIRVTVP
jgi:hypothetical protein